MQEIGSGDKDGRGDGAKAGLFGAESTREARSESGIREGGTGELRIEGGSYVSMGIARGRGKRGRGPAGRGPAMRI